MQRSSLKPNEHVGDDDATSLMLKTLQSQIDELATAQRTQSSMLAVLRMQSTPILCQAEKISPVVLSSSVKHPIFNSSILIEKDQIICMSRSSTLRKIRDKISFYASYPHDTINVIHTFNPEMTLLESVVLDDGLLRSECRAAVYGVEDCRLFAWNDGLWAIGAGVSPEGSGNLFVTQVLFKIENNRVVKFFELRSPFGRVEKNWIPYVNDDRLFIVYSFIPKIIYEFVAGELRLVSSNNEVVDSFFSIRGGTPFIPWKGGLLSVVHETPTLVDKYYYRHMFVFLDDNLNLIELGEPWFIHKRGIEFACGLTLRDDKILMSFGISDRIAAYCELSPALIERWIAA